VTLVPRLNRVTPFGEIIATPERGTFMGNRGVLHDAEGHIKRAWQAKRWIVCVVEFRGRKRTIMSPNSYTELFFLDEATALAAGHRPCAECRHARFLDFCNAWKAAHPKADDLQRPTADEIDNRLHAGRLAPDRSKRFFSGKLDDLPDGVFVKVEGWGEQAFLVLDDSLLAWSPGGYQERRPRLKVKNVSILTPSSTVAAIRAGYSPVVHASAGLR
jgi:hypothetical protein